MSAAPSAGSSTAQAAIPATAEAAAPTTAAPSTEPAPNTGYTQSAKKQKDFTPRQAHVQGSGRSNPGLSMLLSGVSDLAFSGIKHNETTYIVPNVVQMYYVLSIMDIQMVHTKRFTDANSDWHPLVSQLYFGVLVYYQVLKNQRIGGSITYEQSLFLDYLDSQFKAEHFKVPGPLTVFFQALAANAGPNENFGNVVYGIPFKLGVTQRNAFRPVNGLNVLLPNVIFILDQFMRVLQDIAPAGAVPGAVTQASTDRIYMSIFGTAAAAAAVNRLSMLTPSARHDVQVTTSLLTGLAASSNVWRNTLPFDPATNTSTYLTGNNNDPLTLEQVLGFRGFGATVNNRFTWFQQVARIMQPYGDFFKDTVPLGSVTTKGIGISYIVTKYVADDHTRDVLLHDVETRDVRYQAAGTARYNIPEYSGIQTTHSHTEDYLDLVTEQAGMLTQLNVDWTAINTVAPEGVQGPDRANVVFGPLELRLSTRQTGVCTVSNTIPTIVSGYYHVPTALKFE